MRGPFAVSSTTGTRPGLATSTHSQLGFARAASSSAANGPVPASARTIAIAMIAVAAARLAKASLKPAPRAGAGPDRNSLWSVRETNRSEGPRTTGGEQALDFASVVRIGHVSLLRGRGFEA